MLGNVAEPRDTRGFEGNGGIETACDGSVDDGLLLLIQQSYFGLYDGNGAFLKALPMEVNASSEPRCSNSDKLKPPFA